MKKYFLWLLVVLLVVVRYFTTRPVYKNGDRVRVSSAVLSDPTVYRSSQYLKINNLKIYLPKFPAIHYGDFVVIEGNVEDSKLNNAKLTNLVTQKTFGSSFRNRIISFYQKVLPEPEAGLLSGITLGSKGALDNDFYDRTKLTGVAHVVVASGTNVAFVASFLFGISLLFFKRQKSIYIVILGIILYLFLAGFDAPLVRAAVMSAFIFLGEEIGRVVNKWKVYFFTVGLMLVYNPDWTTDLGFLLSFAATASIMLFESKIRKFLKKFPEFFKETLSTTLAAEIGVAPILLYSFGQFNPLSPLINLLVLPTVPPLMVLGAAAGMTGLLWEPVGRAFLYLAYPMLWWFTHVVAIFS